MISEVIKPNMENHDHGKQISDDTNVAQFDIERYFYLIKNRWYLVLLCVALGYFISNLYLRYTQPVYSAKIKLLIKDTKSSGGMSETAIFNDLGLLNSSRNLQNEIQILKTSYLMQQVVRDLKLQYNYSSAGRLKSTDLYNETPVSIISWEAADSTNKRTFNMEVILKGKNQFELVFEDRVLNGQFGSEINIGHGRLILGENYQKIKNISDQYKSVFISISDPVSKSQNLSRRLSVSLDGKTTNTILELSFNDVNANRARDILEKLVDVYNKSEVEDKNRIYEYTLRFINDRLDFLVDELKEVEGSVSSYKSSTNSISLMSEGASLISESASNNRDLGRLNAEIALIGDIRSQLIRESTKFEFVPTGNLINNASLNSLIGIFNNYLLEREKLISELGGRHPNIILIEKQLNNLRLKIIENVNVAESELVANRNITVGQERMVSERLKILPENEKQLLEIQRQQIIKQQLYLYLLQKREETALSLNVTVANNRIIEPVHSGGQISPNGKRIKLIGFTLGFILPIFLILLIDILNKKVMIEEHIKSKTPVPIISTIPFSVAMGHVVIGESKRSATAEMFRLLRANLQFVGEGVDNKLIAITSSVSGEGKSFITLNLGLTLGISGKKILVVELDMRKPKIANYLGHNKSMGKGITEYLVDSNIEMSEIIYKSSIHENLYYVPCGPIPPNPSELLLSDRLVSLIKKLKEDFDYLLIDTPPIGLVSDALLVSKLVDVTFYIVRQNLTEKRQLNILEELRKNRKMPRLYVIFNGVKYGKGGYGYGEGYGHGYGYNYGYGYYGEDVRDKTFLSKMTNFFKRKSKDGFA